MDRKSHCVLHILDISPYLYCSLILRPHEGKKVPPPTWPLLYKYLAYTAIYLYYTPIQDRILFRSNSGTITGCGYDSCAALRCSDHRYYAPVCIGVLGITMYGVVLIFELLSIPCRPVFAVFRVKLEPSSELDGCVQCCL